MPANESDVDNDGYVECSEDTGGWDGTAVTGYDDCDDDDENENPSVTWYADIDGDTYGDPTNWNICERANETDVLDSTDCVDSDELINPSAPDDLPDGIDQNCTGVDFDICENNCTGVDIHGNEIEMHNDGSCDDGGPQADYNFCDFGLDCNDCGPRSYSDENCTDGQDNDGDQLIDCDDSDCSELNSCGPN